MAPPSIGRKVGADRRKVFRLEDQMLPTWAHPEVHYWHPEWVKIRDCVLGEHEIKEKQQEYLPQPEGLEGGDYEAYVERATFYNFTGRTVSALTGSIFRREPVLSGVPARLKERMKKITKSNQSFSLFASFAIEEVLQLGRVGVLLDMPNIETRDPRPYFAEYTAENILDWEEQEIDGRIQMSMVMLREAGELRNADGQKVAVPHYRKLELVPNPAGGWQYRQTFYRTATNEQIVDPMKDSGVVTIPLVNGNPLDYIPFKIIGPFESTLKPEKPPVLDIARLNISHYRSYAELESGRFFLGSPIYYVESPQGGAAEKDLDFTIGAPRVWVTPPGAKPGILEMNGQGLKFLQDALDQKEQQAAALGGRMMGIRGQAVSESDNQLKLAERNEQSILLKITRAADTAFSQLLQWWASWQGVTVDDAAKIEVEFNKDFLFDGIGAREFRAIHAMYKDGFIPIEVFYHYLRKAYIIPDWMTIEEFKGLVDKMESFPNNIEVQAKREGYSGAKARDIADEAELDREHELELLEIENDHAASEADKAARRAEATAKRAAARGGGPPAPGRPPGGPGGGGFPPR